MWKFKFNAPIHCRILSYGFRSVSLSNQDSRLWFYPKFNQWLNDDNRPSEDYGSYSTHHNVWNGAPKTFKAFKKYVERHPELKGSTVTLVHQYYDDRGFNYHIEAEWHEPEIKT